MIDTPRSLHDIESAWLAEALGITVDALTVQPIAVGEGFNGQLARVHLESSDPAAPTAFTSTRANTS